MQIVIGVLLWIGIIAFFWWARSTGIAVTNNVIVITVSGGVGALLLFGEGSPARLLGLGLMTYSAYGVRKTYNIVTSVKNQRAPSELSVEDPLGREPLDTEQALQDGPDE